ncbi:DUF2779 domain-containing protein [Candidatus Microgenomates bacterium]|nr:DUF2779 domain-containing protein [Candidatus Microgenomates bacterium]
MLTKSDFLKFIQCPKYLWLAKFRKDLAGEIDAGTQKMFDDGAEVEKYAYELFTDGVMAGGNNDFKTDISKTKELLAGGAKTIFQPTFSNFNTNLYCRCDIIKLSEDNESWDIYEVKSSTQPKDIHFYDLAFQKICLEKEGLKVGKAYLILVNNQYVRNGDIEPEKLLKIEDVNNEVEEKSEEVKEEIVEALKILELKEEPSVTILKQCKNPYECSYISHCWEGIPEESIYDVASGLSEKQLAILLDMGIINLTDIPEGFVKNEKFIKHIELVKNGQREIQKAEIESELASLEYPLYFIDYETFGGAVPLFDGLRPYENIPFQYSLHVIEAPNAEAKHYEFLEKEYKDPTKDLYESLNNIVGEKGTFISWNMSFEKSCNTGIASRNPEYKEFFEGMNERMFDLMMIFKNGYVADKGFKASASLKKVLPVMVPHLSYKELNIQEGGTASVSWFTLTDEKVDKEEREHLYQDMLKYCELDTLAMVEIWKRLSDL